MREEYLAEEMNERDDLFEDIPDDELEEVEREARELRRWFENPDMWAGKSVHDYLEDRWNEEPVAIDAEEDYWNEEPVEDDDMEDSWDESSIAADDEEDYWDEEVIEDDDMEDSWDESSIAADDEEDYWDEEPIEDNDMEDNWDESSVAAEDEDQDDSDVDIFTDEFDYDDDFLLDLIREEPDESNEEMFEEEDDETLWKSDEEGVIEMDLDDPDVFAFLYMFYMEHADCA